MVQKIWFLTAAAGSGQLRLYDVPADCTQSENGPDCYIYIYLGVRGICCFPLNHLPNRI